MTERQPPHEPLIVSPQLIEEARRHQRRRRGITGAILIAPFAVGCLVVGLSLGGANEQGKAVGTSVTYSPHMHDAQAQQQKSPATTETSSPSTVEATLATERAAAAFALQAAQNAAAAQVANIRSNQLPEAARGEEASQAANAEAQAAAAAAAAAHR